ncbi:HVO_0234 family beta-propeller protein [Halorhabdus amylolytica]|uniref:HVO_0234 family beta-propeller protein n=1 Tax=Halorhabdus amylolytica TaxID=2559573 RepID=UPI0010AA6088|nr:hypothetical protein [Halorhabdus amylolytica]
MGEMAEDRIYADRRGKTDVYVGSELGLTLVAVSDDRVGRFRLIRRGGVQSVAASEETVVIGTDEDVYRAMTEEIESFEALGFGPTVAVDAGGPIAASPDGEVARYDGPEWRSLGTVEDPETITGEWIAAGDGLHRIEDETIERRGPAAHDVTADPVPTAATVDGLYRFADGEWERERRGVFHAITGDGRRSLAVGEEGLIERRDGEWVKREPPTDERIVDVGYGQGIVAVTSAGTILVDPPAAKDGAEGWRSRSLGLSDVTGLAVGPDR